MRSKRRSRGPRSACSRILANDWRNEHPLIVSNKEKQRQQRQHPNHERQRLPNGRRFRSSFLIRAIRGLLLWLWLLPFAPLAWIDSQLIRYFHGYPDRSPNLLAAVVQE